MFVICHRELLLQPDTAGVFRLNADASFAAGSAGLHRRTRIADRTAYDLAAALFTGFFGLHSVFATVRTLLTHVL